MTCVCEYEITPPMHGKSIEKKMVYGLKIGLKWIHVFIRCFSISYKNIPPLHTQNRNHEIKKIFITYIIHFPFPMKKSLNIFSSIGYNS